MTTTGPSPQENALHVTALLVASERALTNALDELGFAEDDNRVVEQDGRFAFMTCSHDGDCDDLFALIAELASRGESWELQFRVDLGENRAIYQRLARHQPVEAADVESPPEADTGAEKLEAHDLDTDTGRNALRDVLRRLDPAELFVTIRPGPRDRALAQIVRRNPRTVLALAGASDEAGLRAAIREMLPNAMFAVAMRP